MRRNIKNINLLLDKYCSFLVSENGEAPKAVSDVT